MRTSRSLGSLAVPFLLALGLIFVVSAVVHDTRAAPAPRILAAPGNPAVLPLGESVAVPSTTTVAITYDEVLDPATVSTRTFAVYGQQTGLREGAYDISGATARFTPTEPFRPGELVMASATTGTLNLSGEGPVLPTVWQFTAEAGLGNGLFATNGQVLSDGARQVIALGDLDADGDLDAVVCDFMADGTRVWLNGGGGRYVVTAQVFGTGLVRSAALGDLDADGDLDLVLGYGPGADKVWFNDGSATFIDSGQSLGSGSTGGLALGDVDGDGDPDLIVAMNGSANTVWLNDGSGHFTNSGQALGNLGNEANVAVALADLDADGDLDAVFAGYLSCYTEVWKNDGSGNFVYHSQLAVRYTRDLAVGDVDGDGDADVVLANDQQTDMVWLNDGTGVFTDSGQSPGAWASLAVALGDVDGDGDLDMAVAVGDPYEPSRLWLNQGGAQGGTLGQFADSGQAFAAEARDIALGDVDGDLDLDMVLAANPVSVWSNGLRDLAIEDFAVGSDTVGLGSSLAVTVVVANRGTGDVDTPFSTAIYSDLAPTACDAGSGSEAQQATPVLAAGGVVTLTFTHPGFATSGMHVIYAQTDVGCITDQVSENNQVGPAIVWVAPLQVVTTSPAGNGREIAADGVVSVTFDKALDMSTVSTRTFTLRGRQTGVYAGTYALGAGPEMCSFQAADSYKPGEELVAVLSRDIQADDGSGLRPYVWQFRGEVTEGTGVFSDTFQRLGSEATMGVALGDVDGDGDLDAVAAHYPTTTLYLNTGGVFTPSLAPLPAATAVALGELNGDADLDLVLGTTAGAEVWVYANGAFTTTGQTLGTDDVTAIALGDVDGDGDEDIAVTNRGAADEVWLNAGGLQGGTPGQFIDSGQRFGTESTNDVALGDVDGDGDLDMVLGRYADGSVLMLNDSAGNFTDSGQQVSASSVWAEALGDLDGDGDLDLFLANGSSPVRLNTDGIFTTQGGASLPSWIVDLALGDVDGDGDLDAFLGRGGESDVANSVWLNNGTGVFVDSGQTLGKEGTTSVALGDLDGDGDVDAFVGNSGNYGEPDTVWFNNKNAPSAVDDHFIVVPDSVGNVLGVLANDSDADGDLAVVGRRGDPQLRWNRHP